MEAALRRISGSPPGRGFEHSPPDAHTILLACRRGQRRSLLLGDLRRARGAISRVGTAETRRWPETRASVLILARPRKALFAMSGGDPAQVILMPPLLATYMADAAWASGDRWSLAPGSLDPPQRRNGHTTASMHLEGALAERHLCPYPGSRAPHDDSHSVTLPTYSRHANSGKNALIPWQCDSPRDQGDRSRSFNSHLLKQHPHPQLG